MRRGLLLLAMIALAACGGGSSQQAATETASVPDAQQAVLEAGVNTQAAESARISFTGTMSGAAASGTIEGEGAFAGRQGRMTIDIDLDGAGGAFSGRMEAIFDGLVFYLKFPPQISSQLPGGKAWVKFDLEALGSQQGIDFEQLMQLSGTDPSRSLALLRAASPDFAAVGDEEVRGVETTHYRGTVDLEKFAEEAPADARESYRRILELTGQKTVPLEVWIDGEGLTRRMRYEQKMPDGSSMTLTQELYDFGVEVDVEAPPASDVLDLGELIGLP
jgi:LppX_LprAFG lipoprotein